MENLWKEHEQLETEHEQLAKSLDSGIASILKKCHAQGMSRDEAKKIIVSFHGLEEDWGERCMQKHWDQMK